MYIFIRIDVHLYSIPHICRLFNRKKNDLDISDFRSFYQTMFQIVSLLRSEIMVHGKTAPAVGFLSGSGLMIPDGILQGMIHITVFAFGVN